jgi:hypothetical protein
VSRLYLGKAPPLSIIGGVAGGVSSGGLKPAPPQKTQLSDLVGEYWSDEAEVRLTAMIDRGRLVLRRRPGVLIELEEIGHHAFRGQQLGTVTFRRNSSGTVEGLSIKQDRVWDLRFVRQN